MTRYRLKKDLPICKKGETFTADEEGLSLMLDDSTKILTLQIDEIENFDEWFEPVADEWPQEGAVYYRVRSDGNVAREPWVGTWFDKNCQDIGNVFKTWKAADQFAKYLRALTIVRQDEGVLTPMQVNELIKNEDLAYYVGYMGNRGNGEVLCDCTMSFDDCWMPVGVILFDSEAHADRSLRNHQDEWKIIANYDWSRE